MATKLVFTVLSTAAVTSTLLLAARPTQHAREPSRALQASIPPAPNDPALLRHQLLARLDARIDEIATRSKLELRAALDEVYPLPYLGVDASPAPGGLLVTAVYADTGAERAGLERGDVLRTFDGVALDSKAALARSVRRRAVGEQVELALERGGKPLTLRATLAPRPEEDEDEAEQFADLFGGPWPVPAPLAFDFEKDAPGALPAGLESLLGGHGKPPRWIVAGTDAARVLRQDEADPTGIRFPLAIAHHFEAADAVVRVRFRYAAGRVDKAAGVVLRFRDPGNYLVARVNAGEADLRIFRVVNGDRRTIPGAIVAAPTDDERWHELEFRAQGVDLTATLDGGPSVHAVDSLFERGRAGLWTKSDSVTEFDDLRMSATR